MRKHPIRFTASVPSGKVSPNRLATNPDNQYLSKVPHSPASPVRSSLFIVLSKRKLLTASRSRCDTVRSHQPFLQGGYTANSIAQNIRNILTEVMHLHNSTSRATC